MGSPWGRIVGLCGALPAANLNGHMGLVLWKPVPGSWAEKARRSGEDRLWLERRYPDQSEGTGESQVRSCEESGGFSPRSLLGGPFVPKSCPEPIMGSRKRSNQMRDLLTEELEHVYGAGGAGRRSGDDDRNGSNSGRRRRRRNRRNGSNSGRRGAST